MSSSHLSTPQISGTATDSSRLPAVASFTSEVSAEPANPERFNVWKLFRLSRGSEKRFLVVNYQMAR
jgi:hypothetical protein